MLLQLSEWRHLTEDFVLCCVCRSYLTPVRDEESESQRKARSRQARQSRRSTQASLDNHRNASAGSLSNNRQIHTVLITKYFSEIVLALTSDLVLPGIYYILRFAMWLGFMGEITVNNREKTRLFPYSKIVFSIQEYLYSAFYDMKQLYRKLSFHNIFIYCRHLTYLTYDYFCMLSEGWLPPKVWHHLFSGVRSSQII